MTLIKRADGDVWMSLLLLIELIKGYGGEINERELMSFGSCSILYGGGGVAGAGDGRSSGGCCSSSGGSKSET